MSEKNNLSVEKNESLGKIEIAPEVIEVITGLAVSEVDGVSTVRGSFAERFGKKSTHSKGVKVELEDGFVVVDLHVVLQYGKAIPKVAKEIQTNVKQTLKTMVDLDVKEINIHVVDIDMDTESSTK